MKFLRKLVLYVVCKFIYRVEYIGLDNVDFKYSNVLAANHTSSIDGILIWAKLDNIAIMAKKELFDNKILGAFLRKVGAFPISRGEKDVKSVYHSVNILRDKSHKSLLIFPEGTRNARQKGIKAKTGAVYMAITTGVNIVPIYIEERKKIFRKTRIIFGLPYKLNISKEMIKDKDILRKETDELMKKIYELKGAK